MQCAQEQWTVLLEGAKNDPGEPGSFMGRAGDERRPAIAAYSVTSYIDTKSAFPGNEPIVRESNDRSSWDTV